MFSYYQILPNSKFWFIQFVNLDLDSFNHSFNLFNSKNIHSTKILVNSFKKKYSFFWKLAYRTGHMKCLGNVCIYTYIAQALHIIMFMPLRKNVREGNETTLIAIRVKEKKIIWRVWTMDVCTMYVQFTCHWEKLDKRKLPDHNVRMKISGAIFLVTNMLPRVGADKR